MLLICEKLLKTSLFSESQHYFFSTTENPKEATWKQVKEEVAHHRWYDSMADLKKAINDYYRTTKTHTVNFLAKFHYRGKNPFLGVRGR